MPNRPFLLFHWSPTTRRPGILRYGLVPGKRSTCNVWRPPYVCFADSPSWAWALSGALRPDHPEWDLWQMWSDVPSGYEELPGYGEREGRVHEYRVYERVFKRDLWLVGSRPQQGLTARR